MTSNQYFSELRKIYFVFLGSIIFVTLIAAYYNDIVQIELEHEITMIFKFIPFVIGFSTLGLALILFKVMTGRVGVESGLSKKLEAYRNAFIIRSALIEGTALLFAVFYALISFDMLLVIAAALAGILFFLKPSPENLKKTFELTATEVSKIDHSSTEVFVYRKR